MRVTSTGSAWGVVCEVVGCGVGGWIMPHSV